MISRQILRNSDYRQMPWKNGGGTTREIQRSPAEGDPFHWRLSMARVEQSGPFSLYPGYRRLLSVLEGAGLALRIDGQTVPPLRPFGLLSFSGDSPVSSELLDGPLLDFNLIYDPLRYRARLTWQPGTREEILLQAQADVLILFCTAPALQIRTEGAPAMVLDRYDTAVLTAASAQPRQIAVAVTAQTPWAAIELNHCE